MRRAMRFDMLSTLATEGATLAFGVLTGALSARLLQPEGRGALAAILFWPQLLAGIGLLSLGEATTYRIGARPERSSTITVSCFWLAFGLSGLTMLLAYIFLPLLLGDRRAHLWFLARAYSIYIPFHFTAMALLATDQGKLQFSRYNILRLLVPLIYLAGLLTMWATGRVSLGWVVVFNCAGPVFVALICVALQGYVIWTLPSWEELKAVLTTALRFHPASVLLLLAGQVDQFVVISLWDDAAVGKYVVALALGSTGLAVVSGAFQKVLLPHLANVDGASAQAEILARAVRHATVLLVGLSLLLGILMPWIVPFLYGSAFRGVASLAWVLLVAYLAVALKTILIQGLRGLGVGGPGFIAAAISLVLFLLLARPLGRAAGLAGVGASLGLANLGAVGYLAYDLRRRYNLPIRHLWGLTAGTVEELLNSATRLNLFAAKTTS